MGHGEHLQPGVLVAPHVILLEGAHPAVKVEGARLPAVVYAARADGGARARLDGDPRVLVGVDLVRLEQPAAALVPAVSVSSSSAPPPTTALASKPNADARYLAFARACAELSPLHSRLVADARNPGGFGAADVKRRRGPVSAFLESQDETFRSMLDEDAALLDEEGKSADGESEKNKTENKAAREEETRALGLLVATFVLGMLELQDGGVVACGW